MPITEVNLIFKLLKISYQPNFGIDIFTVEGTIREFWSFEAALFIDIELRAGLL